MSEKGLFESVGKEIELGRVVEMASSLVEMAEKDGILRGAVGEQRVADRGLMTLFQLAVEDRLKDLPGIKNSEINPEGVADNFRIIMETYFGGEGNRGSYIEANVLKVMEENADFYTGPKKRAELLTDAKSDDQMEIVTKQSSENTDNLKRSIENAFNSSIGRIPHEIAEEWESEINRLQNRVEDLIHLDVNDIQTIHSLIQILTKFSDTQFREGGGWTEDWTARWNNVIQNI